MATIRSKLRYLCNDSKVYVFKRYNSVRKEDKKQPGKIEIATGNIHRSFRPVWLNRLEQRLQGDFGNKGNKVINLKILRRNEPKKKCIILSPKLLNLVLEGLASSTKVGSIGLHNYFSHQKSVGSDQALMKYKKLPAPCLTVKTGLLKELPVFNRETETDKFSHFRPVNKIYIVRRYNKHRGIAKKKNINKQIKMSSCFIKEIQLEFLKLIDKEKFNQVTGMLKLINLNNMKKRVTFYETRRYYHIRMIRYMSNTVKLKDSKSNKNDEITQTKETIPKDNETNENNVNKINNIKNVYTFTNMLNNKINSPTQSYEETGNDFSMNKKFAKLAMIQNLGMTMRKERHNYVNYIRNFFKNKGFTPKRIITKSNTRDNKHLDPRSKTDIDFITKKLKKTNSLDDNPKVSKYTESNTMKLQNEDCTKYDQHFEGSGDAIGNSIKQIGMNSNDEKNFKLQKIIMPEPDDKSKHTNEQYVEDTSLESRSHKRKVEKTSVVNMDEQNKFKSDTKLDRIAKTIENNKKYFEKNKKIANSKTVVNANVKLSELKIQTPQNSTKNNSKSNMNSEENQIGIDELVIKSLINKEISVKKNNLACKSQQHDNCLKQRIKEENKNITTEKAKEGVKRPEKSTTVNGKELESNKLSLKSNPLIFDLQKNLSQNLREIKTFKYVEKAKKNNTKPENSKFINKTQFKSKVYTLKKKKNLSNLKSNPLDFDLESNLSQKPSGIVMTNKQLNFTEKAKDNIRKPNRSTTVNSKELESKVHEQNTNYDLSSLKSNLLMFDLRSNLFRNLSEMLLASKIAKKKPLDHSTTDKLLSCLSESSGGHSTSIFMRYKNSENENYDNRNNSKTSKLHMKKEKLNKNKVGFVYKKQASNKINLIDIENKKRKLRKMQSNAHNINLASMRFDIDKHKKQMPMNIYFTKQTKLTNLINKQYLKNISARSIFTMNTAVENLESESTSNENSTGFVREKKRNNQANKLNYGSEFGVIWNKIKISKPKLVGYVNPKYEVMTKERRNSLERFEIFHNRITQENIHQYKKQSFHLNATDISIFKTDIKSKTNKLTDKECRTDYVKEKLQYNPLTHGGKLSAVRNKIKIAKPKILSYVNRKHDVAAKERSNSLERFKIFYKRIAQENIRQYRVNADKLNYVAKL